MFAGTEKHLHQHALATVTVAPLCDPTDPSLLHCRLSHVHCASLSTGIRVCYSPGSSEPNSDSQSESGSESLSRLQLLRVWQAAGLPGSGHLRVRRRRQTWRFSDSHWHSSESGWPGIKVWHITRAVTRDWPGTGMTRIIIIGKLPPPVKGGYSRLDDIFLVRYSWS
eukprot:1708051-Rhodomonas_salina.2